MKPSRRQNDVPRAAELAAYVDDRLNPAERRRVEEWLKAHPGAAEELHAHEKLQALYQRSGSPEPAEVDWPAMLERIEQGVAERRLRRRASPRLVWGAAGLVAAACLLLALSLGNRPQDNAPDAADVEPFAVVDAADVEITSVEVADASALVVGGVPSPSVIVLLEPGDVTLHHVEKDALADFGQLRWGPQQGDSPMIWAPLIASDSFPNPEE